jgi:hypothetical protein
MQVAKRSLHIAVSGEYSKLFLAPTYHNTTGFFGFVAPALANLGDATALKIPLDAQRAV